MSHDGRMARGKINSDKGILPENGDTVYYLENKGEVKMTEEAQAEAPAEEEAKEEENAESAE